MKKTDFINEKEFQEFVNQLSPQEIRGFTSHDWASLFERINTIVDYKRPNAVQSVLNISLEYIEKPLPFSIPRTDNRIKARQFLNNNLPYFAKMYANYRPEKQYIKQVRIQAHKAVAFMLSKYPELPQKLTRFDSYNQTEQAKICQEISDCLYESFYRGKKAKPKIRIKDKLDSEGSYDTNHSIKLLRQSTNKIDSIFHELWHSMQEIEDKEPITRLLQPTTSKQSAALDFIYRNNSIYYMPSDKDHGAYSRQPIEYDARLFSKFFMHELYKEASPQAFFQQNSYEKISRIFNYMSMPIQQAVFSEGSKNKHIKIYIKNEAITDAALLNEINQRFFKVKIKRNKKFTEMKIPVNRQKASTLARNCLIAKQATDDICANYKILNVFMKDNKIQHVCGTRSYHAQKSSYELIKLFHFLKNSKIAQGSSMNFEVNVNFDNPLSHLKFQQYFFQNKLEQLGMKPDSFKCYHEENKIVIEADSPNPLLLQLAEVLKPVAEINKKVPHFRLALDQEKTFPYISNNNIKLPQPTQEETPLPIKKSFCQYFNLSKSH